MQTIIDFLVNNYLWFIIIALILVFALIGYLVDTNEKSSNKNDSESDLLKSPVLESSLNEPIKVTENVDSINMDMGSEEIQELDNDVMAMPNEVETPLENNEQPIQTTIEDEGTEVLEEL